jgi:enoyl reductase-like protein
MDNQLRIRLLNTTLPIHNKSGMSVEEVADSLSDTGMILYYREFAFFVCQAQIDDAIGDIQKYDSEIRPLLKDIIIKSLNEFQKQWKKAKGNVSKLAYDQAMADIVHLEAMERIDRKARTMN